MAPKGKARAATSKPSSSAVSTILPSALYLGPCSAASSTAFLTSNSINHVLSIGKTPSESPKVDGITYHRLALNDTISSCIIPTIDAAAKIIDAALKFNKGSGRILVHCYAGVSRSPTVVVGYLMKRRGMSLGAALGLVVRARPHVSPNFGFLQQLKDLEVELYDVSTLDVDELPRREVDRLSLFEEANTAPAVGSSSDAPVILPLGRVELR